ncbi:hypothetical protein BG011_004319 [Mortierella polycephala]|uniref:Uncharacterized protein n=1 Tax=Mortierella polycephala TaxID=41804 RepID=A0A9P6U1R5_9FUNG|nr:hypothetical protein BG011_004319 [Mortierella polycephala]
MPVTEITEGPPCKKIISSVDGHTTSVPAQIDPVTGSYIVPWRHIQRSFPGIRGLRHDVDDTPVTYTSTTTRVELSSPTTIDSSAPPFIPEEVQIQNIGPHHRSLQHPPTNYLQETELSHSHTHWPRRLTATYTSLNQSYVEAIMTGRDEQTEILKAHMDTMITAMTKEMAKNQVQLLEKDREAKEMQKRMLEMQEMALNRLAVIQSRVQAILTQSYELFEYPIPRLFIVLPKEPELWDKLNPFTHKFRLYFLCECGEHTSSRKMPHHIHLAKHSGYDLLRPTEFFEKYGPYLLTMMEMIKFGIGVTGVVVPTMIQLKILDGIEEIKKEMEITRGNFAPLLDESISYVRNRIGQDLPDADLEGETHLGAQESLEGADLRQLVSYLSKADEARTLGNLYRTVTEVGHVKWVCFDHYRDGYMSPGRGRFMGIVAANDGEFMEDLGRVEIKLRTPLTAQVFYDALNRTKGVHELTIKLAWDATKRDIQQLCNAILESNVSILTVDGGHFGSPALDVINRSSRFDPFLQLMASGKLQSFTIRNCPRFLDRIFSITAQAVHNLRGLHLESEVKEKESKPQIQKTMRFLQRFPNLTTLSVSCWNVDEMFAYLQESIQQLPQLSVLRLLPSRTSHEARITLSSGKVEFMDLKANVIPELAYSGFLRECTVFSKSFALPDIRRLLDDNKNLVKLGLIKPRNYLEHIFLIDTLIPTRLNPLLVVFVELYKESRLIQMEFWNSEKVPPIESTGKWIKLSYSMIHIQEWFPPYYNFRYLDTDKAVFLSGLEELAVDADEVELNLDNSSLAGARIRTMQKAITCSRPKECHAVLKGFRQEWMHCHYSESVYWSKLCSLIKAWPDGYKDLDQHFRKN